MASDPLPPSAPAVRGRPRSAQARRAVLDAALALIVKGGYPAATIDAIAGRSGVAKTTIYRRWPNRPALVVDLLVELATAAAPPPVPGHDPIQELRTELRLVAEAAEGLAGKLLLSLLAEAECDPETRAALQQGLFTPRRKATAKVIRRAQIAGEIRKDVPPLIAVDLLFGPVFYRKFVRHEPVTGSFVKQVFAHVLAGIGTQATPRRR